MQLEDEIFAANRARGAVTLSVASSGAALASVALVNGATRRRHVAESGSLRVRFPNSHDAMLQAVLVNTAGGIAGGDYFSIDVSAQPDARLAVTSAAAEKVYRSHGPQAQIDVWLKAEARAELHWLPQETILFDRARVNRRIDIDLAADARLVAAEIVVFGRTAMGERMTEGTFVDRWRVRRGGRLIYADTVRLQGAVGDALGAPAIGGGACAIATILIAPGDEALVSRIRDTLQAAANESGVSSWNGVAVVRCCSTDAARLRGDVVAILAQCLAAPSRIWLN